MESLGCLHRASRTRSFRRKAVLRRAGAVWARSDARHRDVLWCGLLAWDVFRRWRVESAVRDADAEHRLSPRCSWAVTSPDCPHWAGDIRRRIRLDGVPTKSGLAST